MYEGSFSSADATGGLELDLVVVQLLSQVLLFATPWTIACQASLSITISWSLLKLMSIESVMLFNHFILRNPLLLLPSIFQLDLWMGQREIFVSCKIKYNLEP